MRHDVVLEGPVFRLRPLATSDAADILRLRCDPALAAFLNPTSPRIEDQVAWTERSFDDPTDCSFVLERRATGAFEGGVSIYTIRTEKEGPDNGLRTAEWGRWILRPGSPAALDCAFLVYRAAFEALDLDEVYCRTVRDNGRVVSFHNSFGLETRRILPGYVVLHGAPHDSVEQVMTRARWAALAPGLASKIARLAGLLGRAA